MSTTADEKAAVVSSEQPKGYSSSEDRPVTQHAADTEAQAGGAYFVQDQEFNAQNHLRLARDGVTVLIPQPDDNEEDPLNWSWLRKHKVLVALLLPSLLTDWGMTWGTTLFEAQAVTWGMAIPDVARSVSGGIFLQGPGGVIAVPFVQRYGR